MRINKWIYLIIGLIIIGFIGLKTLTKFNYNYSNSIGKPIDSLNNVYVYFNVNISNISGRNLTTDGYNLGLKYQCVEFVKRYYFEHLNHKMPESYGDAKQFFDTNLKDGQKNKKRNLIQYSNPSVVKPKINDILIFKETIFNKFGHVAIVSNQTEKEIEIIQQNPGYFGKSREVFELIKENGKWKVDNDRVLGWLRKE